jgi:hypothetical protein
MEIVKISTDEFEIGLTCQEFSVLKNTLCLVCESISTAGFHSRTASTRREAKNLLFLFSQYYCHQGIQLRLSKNEVCILRQSFGEVSYGLTIENFDTKIGISRTEAEEIFKLFAGILDNSSSTEIELRRKIDKNKIESSNIRGEYCLEAEGYKLIFYIDNPKLIHDSIAIFPIAILMVITTNRGGISSRTCAFRVLDIDLYGLISYLQNHINELLKNPLAVAKPFFMGSRSMMEMQAFPGQGLSLNEEAFSLKSMINISDERDDEGIFMGAEASITFTQVNDFILPLKVALDKLLEE